MSPWERMAAVREVGPGGMFLTHGHTIQNMRSLWLGTRMDRMPDGVWEWKKDGARDGARDRARHSLATHPPSVLEPQLEREPIIFQPIDDFPVRSPSRRPILNASGGKAVMPTVRRLVAPFPVMWPGVGPGLLTGSIAGIDRTDRLDGKPGPDVEEILRGLRKKFRIRDIPSLGPQSSIEE